LQYNDSSIARWLSRDPIEERGSQNLYGFLRGDPISLVDYLGLQANNPTGNLSIPFKAEPDGNASANVNYQSAEALTKISVKVIVAAPNQQGEAEDGEIGPIPVGPKGWVPMTGDEQLGVGCRVRYTCVQRCTCAFGTFTVEWNGTREWLKGRVISTLKINKLTGKADKDQNNNLIWVNSQCQLAVNELTIAQADCKNTSKGKCHTHAQLQP
jgi:hypothetical protein